MKKIILTLLLTFVLVSCGEEEIVEEKVKQAFNIQTMKINDFSNSLFLEKTGKLSSSQDIKLSSQIAGRVSRIYVKEGELVGKGDIIARVDDTIANYSLALERAQNALDKAKINYESTENQLDKSISDIKINLENLLVDDESSKSALELEKIENSIKKLALDFETLKISNSQSIMSFKNSFGKDLTTFSTYIDDVIDFSDKILGITTENEDENDDFEDYLGAKDSSQKKETENDLRDLIKYEKEVLNTINFSFEGSSLFDSNMDKISEGYLLVNKLLTSLNTTFDNSISSIGSLSSIEITTYKGSISGYWGSYNINNSGFISLKNSVNTFLDTFQNTEESLLKQIELLVSDKKIYVKSLDVNLELNQATLDQAISNRELTLRQLDTATVDAKISYKQAYSNYEKLAIRAPITGSIGEIFIDEGQEIGQGTQLFNISNNSSNEIIVSFSKDELSSINTGAEAFVTVNSVTYTGSIYSISQVADSNLKYISRVSFDEKLTSLGDVVNVSVPFTTSNKLLPINIIKIASTGKGIVNILVEGEIEEKHLTIGKIFSDKVEILDFVNPDTDIITTNIDNFDITKYNLNLK